MVLLSAGRRQPSRLMHARCPSPPAAELALQRTGRSAALGAPPPLQAETVRAVLGLQPPTSASAACARRQQLVPRGAPHRTAAPLWYLALPHPPPRGTVVGTGSAPLRPCHCFLSPPTPSRGLCWGALRVRWVALLALQPGRLPRAAGGAHLGACPPPTRRRHRPRAPAVNPARLARAAGGASAPAAPQGAPRSQNPSPARRGESIAAWRAPAVKAPRAALTAPAPPLGSAAACPGNGLGLRAGRTGGAPVGRGVAPCGGRRPRHGQHLASSTAHRPLESRRALRCSCRSASWPDRLAPGSPQELVCRAAQDIGQTFQSGDRQPSTVSAL